MSAELWDSFVNPRAYTAAPMAAGVAVFHAATWVFSHSAELTWASLAIVVPDPSQVPIIEQLGRLKTRGCGWAPSPRPNRPGNSTGC